MDNSLIHLNDLKNRLCDKIDQLRKGCFKLARIFTPEALIFGNIVANGCATGGVKAFTDYTLTKDATSQGFLKATAKIEPEVIKEFSDIVIEECYKINPIENHSRNLGITCFASVDGSIVRISKDIQPNREQKEKEGIETNEDKIKRLKRRKRPIGDSAENFELIDSGSFRHGLVMTIYDTDRNIPIAFEIFYSVDERKAFLSLLPSCMPGTCFILDRGFYSFEVVNAIENAHCFSVFRLKIDSAISKIEGEDVDIPFLPSIKIARKLEYTLQKKITIKLIKNGSLKKIKIGIAPIKKIAINLSKDSTNTKIKIKSLVYRFITTVPRNVLSVKKFTCIISYTVAR